MHRPRLTTLTSSPDASPPVLHLNLSSTLSAGVSGVDAKVDAVLITALDETAWLFNLRGNDVDFNPVFVSYGIITAKEATLFVDPAKVGRD